MWPYHPELLARPVPRYTSYPTAAEFRADIGAPQLAQALEQVEPGATASLYVHIPFCHEICAYCGCNTTRANRIDRVLSYVQALEAEISALAARVAGRISLRRIAFGGGSPNALGAINFVRLADHLLTSFGAADPEMSVEIDPRTFGREWADMLGGLRVGRASLGVQTFAPHVQRAIGRVQPHGMIAQAVDMLRANGVHSLNFDMMYGLPGQSGEDLCTSLEMALAMAPERVALFGYAHVPHLIPRQRQIDDRILPDTATRFAMAAGGHAQLVAGGMQPVGFDHFALPHDPLAQAAAAGDLRRNFQGFTDDGAEILLGVGATAISVLPGVIVQNEKNVGRYRMRALAGQLPAALGVARDAEDRVRGAAIEGLLCGRAVNVRNLGAADALAPFVEAGLCSVRDDALALLPPGLPYARAIAATLDRHRANSVSRFSNAV